MVDRTHSVEDEMVKALGQFIWNFNRLDHSLDDVLALLLNPDDIARGEIVGGALMFRNKCLLIKALIQHVWEEEASKAFEPLFSRLERMRTARNGLAHGEQWFDLEGVLRQRNAKITEKGYAPKHTAFTPSEVSKFASEAYDLEQDLIAFAKQSTCAKDESD